MSNYTTSIFANVCRKGQKLFMNRIISSYNFDDWNVGLASACEGGQKEIVELMIEKGANNFDRGLYNACVGGHKEIIELMISKGANDFNRGLNGACYGGNKEIIELMISKGARDWTCGLLGACYGEHNEIILLTIIEGANINKCLVELDFEDIYYLLQATLLTGKIIYFGKYSNLVLDCKKWKQEFQNVANELFISDIASIITSF